MIVFGMNFPPFFSFMYIYIYICSWAWRIVMCCVVLVCVDFHFHWNHCLKGQRNFFFPIVCVCVLWGKLLAVVRLCFEETLPCWQLMTAKLWGGDPTIHILTLKSRNANLNINACNVSYHIYIYTQTCRSNGNPSRIKPGLSVEV